MTWTMSRRISLRNERVADADADRQAATAAEILRRLDDQPGIVLADEVGMGKTYVALAVAVSVLESTKKRRPIVIMVPSAVVEKWPTEWSVFSERCLKGNHGLRASQPVRNGSEFLKLLDDPARERKHLLFVTHGALTRQLNDPFIKLAIIRQATAKRPLLANRRRAIARFSRKLFNPPFGPDVVQALLDAPPSRWKATWNRWRPNHPLDDDPVPLSALRAMKAVPLAPVREVVAAMPIHNNASLDRRLKPIRAQLRRTTTQTWKECLGHLDEALPLLILDEAHHVKNVNQLSRLLANDEAEADVDALQGPLGGMFERMLFLTATPFQLGHHELISVLDRFHGIRWASRTSRASFDEQLDALRASLDRAQASALRLERAWSRIGPEDAAAVESLRSAEPAPTQPESVRTALEIAQQAAAERGDAEVLLRPWVIRHARADKAHRRRYLPGAGIAAEDRRNRGLSVDGAASLPFLLAARAQALSSLAGADGAVATRSYFAYGLASSFEAYADTRRNRSAVLDDDVGDDRSTQFADSPRLRWYLDRISAALPDDTVAGWAAHPKVRATVDRARALWCDGEKALIFCFYVETGRALRAHVSRAIRAEVLDRGARALSIDPADEDAIVAELDRTAERLLRSESRGFQLFRAQVASIANALDADAAGVVADVVVRFMRTASFLVRFVDLSPSMSEEDLLAGLEERRLGGQTLAERIRAFAELLAQKVDVEREALVEALHRIQTGGIAAVTDDFDESERSARRETLMPNVRLANGGVRAERRRRLMLAFNTPFFPEVLVASSVMAEGVDLHRECRHVIHHDLDWNPSTLEQRTGRVDRIGSLGERLGQPVVVFEPYLGGTHDEKMFRVVKDRERWFGVVMGETPDSSEWTTERQAARVPLPDRLAEGLTMDLSLQRGRD
jgi:superfamily II DNA or RNA helicase